AWPILPATVRPWPRAWSRPSRPGWKCWTEVSGGVVAAAPLRPRQARRGPRQAWPWSAAHGLAPLFLQPQAEACGRLALGARTQAREPVTSQLDRRRERLHQPALCDLALEHAQRQQGHATATRGRGRQRLR